METAETVENTGLYLGSTEKVKFDKCLMNICRNSMWITQINCINIENSQNFKNIFGEMISRLFTLILLSPNASIGNEGMVEKSGNLIFIALKRTHIRIGFVTNIRNIFGQITSMDG